MLNALLKTGSLGDELRLLLRDKVVLCDTNTAKYCAPLLQLPSEGLIVVSDGESSKNWDTCELILSAMLERGMDRSSELWILGGGVLCDMGGFCASIYMRGIPFHFVPTTLLCMVDAGLGGKLGIDWRGLKNYLGMFCEPESIWCDPVFLLSLPTRQWSNAWVEMLKHALIWDRDYWRQLSMGMPMSVELLLPLIRKSQEIKIEIAGLDPYESGQRKLLNAGHTIGHAFESWALQNGRDVFHGEAVAFGLFAELRISYELGYFKEQIFTEISHVLLPFLPQDRLPSHNHIPDLMYFLGFDKKKSGQRQYFSLIMMPGEAKFDVVVPLTMIERALNECISSLSNAAFHE